MTDKDELEKCFLDRISEPPEDSGGGDHVFSREYERKKQRLLPLRYLRLSSPESGC